MTNKIFITIFLFLIFIKPVNSNEVNCNEFKKFSVDFMKCKASLLKKKTVYASKNLIEDTKNYQKKEWYEEKKKLTKLKKRY